MKVELKISGPMESRKTTIVIAFKSAIAALGLESICTLVGHHIDPVLNNHTIVHHYSTKRRIP